MALTGEDALVGFLYIIKEELTLVAAKDVLILVTPEDVLILELTWWLPDLFYSCIDYTDYLLTLLFIIEECLLIL